MATSTRYVSLSVALACTAGCNNPAYYAGAERLAVTAADITAAQGEDSMTGNPTIGAYVQGEYWLDFRDPGADELAELQPMGTIPAEQTPWIRAEDLAISLTWKLTNETDGPLTAWVLLDGATEFYDYDPISTFGAAGGADEDEVQYPSLLGFTPRNLAPGEVLEGEFREDDLREAMYDLDVITRFCGGPLAVLNHRHEADPSGTDAVPSDAVLAGAVMLRLTLGASAPASLEYGVRLREREAKIYDSARDERRYETEPEPYALPSAPVAVDTGTGGEMDMCEAGG